MIVDKCHPQPAWIESLRDRFPCEAEIDRILTRKLQRRSGHGYSPVALETLCEGVRRLLREEVEGPFEVLEPRWLSGGASKVQMAFKLAWNRPGVGRTTTPMVLRMEPAESIVETSRLREFQLMKAMEAVVPVPRVFWLDAEGKHLPYPAMICGFASGVAKPTAAVAGGPSGLGTNFGPAVRAVLGPQFVEHLAAIHAHDWRTSDLSAFDVPALGTQSVEWQLNCWARVWEEDANEDVPLLRYAASWLRANMPPVDRISVVHSDYRSGNFLYDERSNRITTILDWELGFLGDRHLDIAFVTNPAFGHLSEDGKTFLVGGLMTQEAFYEAYEKAAGMKIDRKTVDFYRVFNAYKLATLALGTTYRAARGAKTHQDVVLTYLIGVGYTILEELRALLEALD
ncbi:phosphotransferase family protein [Aromatoleum toluclasticum]|uniref:phosphotransferase family protein n=1 Tax=Aromatoleum toluclasticum TaxID=92003 RepID=UPI000370E892|nr:phosphotransferase family protein [Aromatoleum toluclasticum]